MVYGCERRTGFFDAGNNDVVDEPSRAAGLHFPVVEGVGVDGDTVGVAQDGVLHHSDPGVNGRDRACVPNHIVVFANVRDLLYDVLGGIGDFVSDGQAVNIVATVFLHGIDECIDIFVDLVETGET